MKLIIATLIATLTLVTTVSAATGSTSTGSTSTGSTSTGTTSVIGAGGVIRGFNITTKQYEFVPQCFPWVWLTDYYAGNIFMMYENQKACQKQRSVDFGI